VQTIKLEVTRTLMTVQIRSPEEIDRAQRELAPAVENVRYQHAGYEEVLADCPRSGANLGGAEGKREHGS